MIKMVNFFHLIIFLLIVKQNKYSIEKALYLYLFHLDSYKQIDYNFFFNCTYKLSLRILLYYFSVQEVTKKKKMHHWAINVILSISRNRNFRDLHVFVAIHNNFEVNICQKNKYRQYCFTVSMASIFSKQTILMANSSIRSVLLQYVSYKQKH